MNPIRTLACFGTLMLAAACSPSGYYDSQGYYHTYDNGPHSETTPGGSANTTIIERDRTDYHTRATAPAPDEMIFSRQGFYDHNGYFITMENGPAVPGSMIPARGMCRVWFTDRQPGYQPPAENCNGIVERLPSDAYVLFGG